MAELFTFLKTVSTPVWFIVLVGLGIVFKHELGSSLILMGFSTLAYGIGRWVYGNREVLF